MLLGILLISAILLGLPVVAYCLATLTAPETPAQRRKRDAKRRDERAATRAAARTRRLEVAR